MTKEEQANINMTKAYHKPGAPLQPIRIPHCDSTALGGRQSVRGWMKDLTDLANQTQIIATEEAICADAGLQAKDKRDRHAFEDKYNDHVSGKLGPRYAAFSIWRPLKQVTRDPLAMASWNQASNSPGLVIEPYNNRVQGYEGDWIKELAFLKVRPEAVEEAGDSGLKFYYVSNMQPHEVLFVKLFDTAGLGKDASEDVGCLHGSPDLGEAAYGDPRESVEVRCMAFW